MSAMIVFVARDSDPSTRTLAGAGLTLLPIQYLMVDPSSAGELDDASGS